MADKAISDLTKATALDDDSLLVAEQSGSAVSVSGKLFKEYARATVSDLAAAAEDAANRAEEARDSIEVDEKALAQAVEDAEESAANAKTSETNAAKSEANAKTSETLAQSYAEQASVPSVAGVYNVVLTDRVTAERYALIVEEGRIKLLGVADSVEATELTLIDVSTGISYAVVIDDGRLNLEEVE